MKKLLLSSAVLLIFSFAILIFQASCKKEALAESPVNGKNTILYTLGEKSGTGIQLWMAKLDGTGKKQITLTVPAGSSFIGDAALSPDGRILYVVSRPTGMGWHNEVWSVLPDGTNGVKVLDNVPHNTMDLTLKGAW